jgi:hypothetical protein
MRWVSSFNRVKPEMIIRVSDDQQRFMNCRDSAVLVDGRLSSVDGSDVGSLFVVVPGYIHLRLRKHIDLVEHSESGVIGVLGVGELGEEFSKGIKAFFGCLLITLGEVLLGEIAIKSPSRR